MDVELAQCLGSLPTFVTEMEAHSQSSSLDMNLIEWINMRLELFLELLRVLIGKTNIIVI